jgi:hypothetical protein
VSRRYAYTGIVVSRDGITTTHLVNGSTAAAALTNLRRLRRGDWRRIEVGTGEGTAFRMLAEMSR